MHEDYFNGLGPLISIIVPIYNTQRQLVEDCIDSIINQTYSKLEIIIVDDGSEEQTADFLDRIGQRDKRIRVIHKEHEGVSCARNLAIEEAHGDYIMCVDADDYLYSNIVISEALSICKRASQIPDIIIGLIKRTDTCFLENYQTLSEKDYLPVKAEILDDKNELISQILVGDSYFFPFAEGNINIGPVAKLVHIALARKNLFDSGLAISEDNIWFLHLVLQAKAIYLIKSVWYCYYQNRESVTNRFRENRKEELLQEMAIYQDIDSSLPPGLENDLFMRYWWELVSFYRQYLFHKENDSTFNEKYRDFRDVFMLEGYKKMAKKVNFLYHRKNVKNVTKQIAVRSADINIKLSFD